MVNESRADLYDYIKGIVQGVTDNIHKMGVPEQLTKDEVENGFIVIRAGGVSDQSEFRCEAYALVRAYIIAYVPTKSRGRLDAEKYEAFEKGINDAVNAEMNLFKQGVTYSILSDGMLSEDDKDDSNQDNIFYMYIKSFIVQINNINEE